MPDASSAQQSSASASFTPTHYFPSRRRVWQACTNCRARKTRCDAAKPKCSLCMSQGVECVYQDSQQPKIEHNTRILLERIQMLEDRIFSSPAVLGQGQARSDNAVSPQAARQGPASSSAANEDAGRHEPAPSAQDAQEGDSQIPIPLSHTANANHVFDWPVVQQLLADSGLGLRRRPGSRDAQSTGATDVFFLQDPQDAPGVPPPPSWRIFDHDPPRRVVEEYRSLVFTYFDEVNVFYPLLSLDSVLHTLDTVCSSETSPRSPPAAATTAEYCLLQLVLCLGDFVRLGCAETRLDTGGGRRGGSSGSQDSLHEWLWQKAQLLLGSISTVNSLEAAQCSMLAAFYMGARGQIKGSFHWAHATAVKCEAIAKRTLLTSDGPDSFSEGFRRLYWVAFIYEGDFVSEISITLPSGISRYEDLVPYPANTSLPRRHNAVDSPSSDAVTPRIASYERNEELVAFQISTNAAIRRFLNRVNSVVYDSKDQFRMTRSSYANWLLRTTEDLWSYHDAIYKNLPDFLLKSQPHAPHLGPPASPADAGAGSGQDMGNNPWNVRRLEGRYYAGQYIIHRPFLEYVLLNVDHFQTHPCREAILERGRMCLQGCRGFIKVFDVEPANSVTCLFAAGMVTFTMIIILRVATVCPVFSGILPADTEHIIGVGKQNLRRFSNSIKELSWHMEVLRALDEACHRRAAAAA